MSIISVSDLKKNYGKTEALRGVSLDVAEGEIVAVLGPNGAGKTTFVNILIGLIKQNFGTVSYNGVPFDPEDPAAKRFIGMVPQHNNLDRDISVAENLKIHGLLFGMRGKALKTRIDEVLETVELTEKKESAANDLSGGMKRRLVIARALMHHPKILFLDEPSAGLDPSTRRNIHTLIRRLNGREHVTIILTTHYMEEADFLANRVVFINKGEIAVIGTPQELKASVGAFAVEYTYDDEIRSDYFDNREDALVAAKNHSGDVRVREVTLEDAYLKITGKGLMHV